MGEVKIITRDISLDKIEPDIDQPRKDLGIEGEENRLVNSIKEIGLRSSLAVVKNGNDKYKIIDGHRRFKCAKILKWKIISCDIHPESNGGEIKRIRFDLQNNHRPWKPLERSQEVKQIKRSMNFKTNKDLAKYLHYPEALLSQSLTIQKRRENCQKIMDEYELTETYQVEFVSFEPKIRPVKEFTREQIIRNIFERVKHQVIRSAKDFRKLSSIFLRAHANEKEIYEYLKDLDMKVEQLAEKTTRSGLVRDIENITRQISIEVNKGIELPQEVKTVIIPLHKLFNKCLE